MSAARCSRNGIEVLGRLEQLPDGRVLVHPAGTDGAVSLGVFPVHADDPTPEEALPAIAAFFNGREHRPTS